MICNTFKTFSSWVNRSSLPGEKTPPVNPTRYQAPPHKPASCLVRKGRVKTLNSKSGKKPPPHSNKRLHGCREKTPRQPRTKAKSKETGAATAGKRLPPRLGLDAPPPTRPSPSPAAQKAARQCRGAAHPPPPGGAPLACGPSTRCEPAAPPWLVHVKRERNRRLTFYLVCRRFQQRTPLNLCRPKAAKKAGQ